MQSGSTAADGTFGTFKKIVNGKTGHRRARAMLVASAGAVAGACLAMQPRQAHAASGVWIDNATSGGLWSTTTNWQGGIVASGSGYTATFNTPSVANTVQLNAPYTLGGINFNNSSTTYGWTIGNNGSSSNILTLATGSGVPTITTTTASTVSTINAALAGTQGFTYSGPGYLALNSSASTISGTAQVTASTSGTYLQIYNTASIASLSAVNFTSGTSGTSGMQLTGGVTVPSTTPLNFNMNSGGRVDFDSIGSGTVTINSNVSITNGNSGQITEFQMEGANMAFNGNVTVSNYANANFQLRASASSGAGLGSFNGNLILPAGVTLLLNQDGGFGFTYSLNSSGNSFTLFGETYGTIRTGVNGALPAASVYSDATSAATSGVLDLYGTVQTITGLNEVSNGNYTIGSSSNTSNAVLTLNNSTGITYNYRGTIINSLTDQGSTGTQTVALAMQQGTQTLSGASTFSGGTTITGGTLNLNNSSALGTGAVVVTGPGTLDNVSGTFATLNNLNLSGATITANSGVNATSNGAYGLVGTVTVGGTAASTITPASGANNAYVQIGSTTSGSTTTFNVGSTGATGADFVVNVPIANYQSGSGFVAVANLTKTGAGTMQVNGVNTYTGMTNISAGTLVLGPSASIAKSSAIYTGSTGNFNTSATGGYTTLSNQVLEGIGSVTGLVTHNAGLIVPGVVNTSGGTLTFNSGLTLNGGSLQFDLTATPGSSANSLINVVPANGLTNNAAMTALNVYFTATPSGSLVYPLFDYSGTLNGNWNNSNFTISTNAGRATATIDTSTSGVVNLDVTATLPANLIWASTSSQAWDIQTSKNWNNTTTPALNPDYFYTGDNVTFDDTAGVVTNINLTTTLAPSSVSVTSNTNNFNFSGSGSISGTTGLTKTGSSVLTISNTNTFTGTANISGGSVVATGVNSLGTGPLNIGTGAVVSFVGNGTTGIIGNSSVVDNGSLVLNQSANYNAPTIIGTGTVTANNASGGVSFAPTDNYSGGTYITAGQNYLGFGGTAAYTAGYANGALGTGTANLTGGELTISYLTPVIANNFNIGNAILHVGFQQTAVLTGTINLTGPATFACDGGTNFDLTGPMYNTAGNTTTVNYGNGLTIATTAVLFSNTSSISINSDTLTLAPPASSNYSIPSVISSTGTSPLLMAGPGIAVLSATNTFSGGTTISGGILIAASNTALSTGAVAINGGANIYAELALPGGVNISNAIAVGGRTGTFGPYIDNLSGNNTVASTISLSTGGNEYAIESDAGLLTISGQITQTAGTGTRYYIFQGAGNGLVTSPIVNGTAVPIVEMNGTGTWTFTGSNSYGGVTQVSSGTLAFAPNYSSGIQVINLSGGLNISNGALAQVNASSGSSTRSLMLTSSISLGTTGKLDLANNDLDVQGGSLSAVTTSVAQGFNGGTWNNTGGIVSTAAAGNSMHLTALGVIQNNQGASGNPLYSSSNPFDGTTPAASDILVKYTYYGDANLDGKVDGSDYSLIDSSYEAEATESTPFSVGISGWYNGDFNYDGVVNGSDYTLIDNAFNSQGTQISALIASPSAIATAQIAGSGATSAVPEPASLGLLGIAAAGLLGRRRRR